MSIKSLIFKEQVSPPQYQQDQQRGDFATQVPADNSLDMKVDRYLVRYEREAIPTQSVYEGTRFEKRRLQKLAGILTEQADPPEEEETDDAPADDAPADDAGGGLDFDLGGGGGDAPADGAGAQPSQAAMKTPRLDLAKFAGAVARLVENYDQLLDPRTTILNRARTYILNNYNEAMAEQLMTILQTNYQLSAEKQEDPQAPLAVGAWPVGGG
jgi:hypothetical protein